MKSGADAGLGADAGDAGEPGASGAGAMPRVDFVDPDFYAAPFPDERLRRGDGTIDLSAFPNPSAVTIVDQLRTALADADGFGRSSGVFFAFTQALDPESLPSLAESITDAAQVFLIDVDASSAERGQRFPVDARFETDGGPFGAPNLLSLLPLQGKPLRPSRLYAAVVTTSVHGMGGQPIGVAPATAQLIAGRRPAGISDQAFAAHMDALAGLRAVGVELRKVAATAVFRTGDPVAALGSAREQVLAGSLPALSSAFAQRETFDDYCVYFSTIRLPNFQRGTPPYNTPADGGRWERDASGALVPTESQSANVWLTIPRKPMPAAGFPLVVFVRTGAGGDRPLVDRGVQSMTGGAAITPGSGPAQELARSGVAGISVDGPLGGARNTGQWDEQYAIFNINNPAALRDNIRQSALELILFAHVAAGLELDASDCVGPASSSGLGHVHFDASSLTLMSHSMGSTIGPLSVALEPLYRAEILSGAGGSWIENIVYKQKPTEVRPLAEVILGYAGQRSLTEHDVVLSLLQWAGEPADPPLYANLITSEPKAGPARHVLMFQGLLDTYIPPPVANPLTLALGLDLAGPELDGAYPDYTPLSSVIGYGGGAAVGFPVRGNRASGQATAALAQHMQDAVEDGHEVMFQTEAPKRQYRCFLQTMVAAGTPSIVDGAASSEAPCE